MNSRFKLRNILRGIMRRIKKLLTPKLPLQKVWRRPVDVVVICPSYPGRKNYYGGQFVQARVKAYCESGLSVVVIVSRPDLPQASSEWVDDVPVWRTCPGRLSLYLKKQLCRRIVLHHPEAENWAVVAPYAAKTKPLVIFHGYEARSWRVLESSYSAAEIDALGDSLDHRDDTRRRTVADILSQAHVTPIFVSETMRHMAEAFSEAKARHNSQIIHNPILQSEFPYKHKTVDDRYKILWLRSFQSHNYANDLSRDTILELSKRDDFHRFKITICGDGKLWESIVSSLAHFDNIDFRRGYVRREYVTRLHAEHGIMLAPSRWESQGLTLGEAMSSGLVPVTNAVAAVTEFISTREGRLCPPEDAVALATAIGELVDNPEIFLRLSRSAGQRSTQQCGRQQTVEREVVLLRTLN